MMSWFFTRIAAALTLTLWLRALGKQCYTLEFERRHYSLLFTEDGHTSFPTIAKISLK
jgi:hypothetical protein